MPSSHVAAFVQHVVLTQRPRQAIFTVSDIKRCTTWKTSKRKPIRAAEAVPEVANWTPAKELENPKLPKTVGPVRRFLRLVGTEWRLLVPALLCALIASIIDVMEPILYARLVIVLVESGGLSHATSTQKLLGRVAAIGVAYILETLGTFLFVFLMIRAVERVTRRLRAIVFQTTTRNDIGFFDTRGRSEVGETLTKEIQVVRETIWRNLSEDRGIRAVMEISLGMVVCLAVTGRASAPFFGIFVPIVATVVAQLGMRNGRLERKVVQKDSHIKLFANEKLRGLRTVKVFGAEKNEMGALKKLMNTSDAAASKFGKSKATTEAANRIAMYATILTLFLYGGRLLCQGVLSFEQFTTMTGFLWLLNFAIQGILYTVTDLSILRSSLQRIYALIDKAESYRSLAKAALLPADQLPTSFQGQVRFHNVHFHYPSRPDVTVLKGIDFAIQPGKTVALTGSSGGGKSTIAAMLSRFYAPTEGTVTLDGIDVQTFSTEVYAEQISLVDQEPVLFQGTIRENIAYGANSDSLSDEAIVRAAEEANAHDFIMKLPEKYDTVWTAGSNLSGGQKQRIAIARSLVKSPRVLLLDEATSALDQESERAVQNALDRLMKHRTVLIIAHRLSTVRSADTILFINNGEVEESGTYDELVKRPKGKFRALVEAAMQKMETSTERSVI